MRLRGWLGTVAAACWALCEARPASAQNAAPKNESDCGLTTMCASPVAPHHGHVPLWAVELMLFAVLLVVVAVGYRLLLARHRPAS